MENNKDITLTIQQGGMIIFEVAGDCSGFLVFHSKSLKRTWRFKLNGEKQQGVLKVKGQIAFYYFLDGLGCKMERVLDGVVKEEWEIGEILYCILD